MCVDRWLILVVCGVLLVCIVLFVICRVLFDGCCFLFRCLRWFVVQWLLFVVY